MPKKTVEMSYVRSHASVASVRSCFIASKCTTLAAASADVACSVKKPKTLAEVWSSANDVISDALRRLEEGVSVKRYMTCYS